MLRSDWRCSLARIGLFKKFVYFPVGTDRTLDFVHRRVAGFSLDSVPRFIPSVAAVDKVLGSVDFWHLSAGRSLENPYGRPDTVL